MKKLLFIVLLSIVFNKSLLANDISNASKYTLKECTGHGEIWNVNVDLNKNILTLSYDHLGNDFTSIPISILNNQNEVLVTEKFLLRNIADYRNNYTSDQKIAFLNIISQIEVFPLLNKFTLHLKSIPNSDNTIKSAIKEVFGNSQHDYKSTYNCLSLKIIKKFENKKNYEESDIVPASSGTGFFVSTNGHMVTNNHVIDSCDVIKVHYKGRELNSDVLFKDRTNDLAIIKSNIKPNRVFPVSNEDVTLLEDIIVAGYPLGKNISASIKTFKGSVTALAGYGDNYSNFQIDASLSSGNSGGPIINQKGNVVGVAVEKLVEVGVEGFNFGVKSSTLKTFASSNQFKFQDPSTEELSNKELGQLITEATIYLECWMSIAKIKKIIEEGETQKAFFSDYK
tara:strand:- start:127 stop:1317 length:1191 start_codon:yes stop_codon:yes gene_type:complete